MHLDVTPEVLISQLGYSNNEHTLEQMEKAIENTKDFDKFSKHIISFNDNLKHMKAYIALSNSTPYFKIKCDESDAPQIVKEFNEAVQHFSEKYHVEVEKLPNKEVYYIKGKI
jgi:hypothetical protein